MPIVDDLTNYLGPDPNASGDGGFTKVWSATGGQTWTFTPTLLMDMTFGFARQKQDVLGPDFNAGNYGLDVLGIPGTNDQGIGDQRYAGYPVFQIRARSASRQPRRLESHLPRRAHVLAGHEPVEAEGPTRSARRILRELHVPGPLAAGNWQPAREFTFNGAPRRWRRPDQQFLQCVRGVHAGSLGDINKSVQNELMTAREWQHALFFRDRWSAN